MSRDNTLDFSSLDQTDDTTTSSRRRDNRRWRSRDVNPVVQMSLRMKEGIYDRFRQHCETDRRTNGEMLEIMMQAYERELKSSK